MVVLLGLGGWALNEAEKRQSAHQMRERLEIIHTDLVPATVNALGPYRGWINGMLYNDLQHVQNEKIKLHLSMALLPVDPSQADYLCDRLLWVEGPEEVWAIRTVLHEYAPASVDRFWPVLQGSDAARSRRLRAACALAPVAAEDARWAEVSDEVARGLAGENLIMLGKWAQLLQPVRKHLVPHLVRRLLTADARGFPALLAVLSIYAEETDAELHGQLQRTLPPTANTEEKRALARQQARAAVALLQLGRPRQVWPLFHQGADPTFRTYLIHYCAELGVDPATLTDGLSATTDDPSAFQGVLLALGEYDADQRAEVVRGPLVGRILYTYQYDHDPGVHSAAEWLLRRWKMTDKLANIDQQIRSRRLTEQRVAELVLQRKHADPLIRSKAAAALEKFGSIPGSPVPLVNDKLSWYVNSRGQTFAVIPAPGKFQVGSPPDEKGRVEGDEDRRKVQIDYVFAVATKLVTVAEFKKCLPAFQHQKQWSPGENTPINAVSWYDAARYCNWLSEQEKVPQDQWCYEPNARGEYALGMKVKPNYRSLSGYRLPNELEWEYACRAGALTAWAHGSDEALLGHYAWYLLNSNSTMHPVGSLKPNALGLFDMHGNAWQWCQEVYEARENKDVVGVIFSNSRVVRGGPFDAKAGIIRSAFRLGQTPWVRGVICGFRVARTYR
jgi:formylglycine-generating enzyme required for sulfatase activity